MLARDRSGHRLPARWADGLRAVRANLIDDCGAWCLFQLELIIDSETGFASSTNILNLVDQLKGKKMRKKEAEHVLQKFVQSKWLIEVLSRGLPSLAHFFRLNDNFFSQTIFVSN